MKIAIELETKGKKMSAPSFCEIVRAMCDRIEADGLSYLAASDDVKEDINLLQFKHPHTGFDGPITATLKVLKE